MLFFAHTNEPPPDQRPGLQIKCFIRFLCNEFVQARLRVVTLTQIVLKQKKIALFYRKNPLDRLVTRKNECCAQSFMARHDPIECNSQSDSIYMPLQMQMHGDVICLTHSLHLRQEPQPLLSKRKRNFLLPLNSH